MTDDLDTVTERLDATARAATPSRPPAALWTRGRRARRRRQVATGVGAAAAAAALVLPAIAVTGLLPGGDDRATDVAGSVAAMEATGLPDKLYPPPSGAPRERAPGRLAATYQVFEDNASGRQRVVGVTVDDGRTVVLAGMPSSVSVGGHDVPKLALSPDGGLLAYARGGRFEDFAYGPDPGDQQLVVRDLRSGDEVVADLPRGAAEDLDNMRSMGFSGGMLLMSLDRVPGESLHAVDPLTGETIALASDNESFMWAGASGPDPVFTVDRRVFTGAEPPTGREPVLQAPAGYSLSRAALSPDGSRAVTVMSEVFDGTDPEPPQLQMTRVDEPRRLMPLPLQQEGARVEAWLPQGIALRLPQQSTEEEFFEVDAQAWVVLDPDRPGERQRRVVDISEIDPDGIIVATHLLANPLRPAVDPDPFPVVATAAGGALAAAGIGALVVIRRRRRAAR